MLGAAALGELLLPAGPLGGALGAASATPLAIALRTLIAEHIGAPGMRAETASSEGLLWETARNALMVWVAGWAGGLVEGLLPASGLAPLLKWLFKQGVSGACRCWVKGWVASPRVLLPGRPAEWT